MSKGGIGKAVGQIVATPFLNKGDKAMANAYRGAYDSYKSGLTAEQARLNPYAEQGGAGMSALSGLLTGRQYDESTGELKTLTPEQRSALFQTSPNFQFRMDSGLKAVQASQAAKGGLLSGGALKEITQYSQGLAGDEYNNYINQLAGLAGMGQNAATTQSNYGVGGLGDLSSLYLGGQSNKWMKQYRAGQMYGGLTEAGVAAASSMFTGGADAGASGATGGGLGSFSTQLSNPMAMFEGGAAASDINLKENILKIGKENGFNIYEFNYKGNPDKYQGVMAQEVQETRPDAVFEKDGFLGVNYDKIGIQFKKI